MQSAKKVSSRVLKAATKTGIAGSADPEVKRTVETVIEEIRERGDDAVREYSAKFDDWEPSSFQMSDDEILRAIHSLPQEVIDDIEFVQRQVRGMATRQRESLEDFEMETLDGVILGQKNVPISRSGAYVPGGKYPLLASAHMTIVTAKVAGVANVVSMTPPLRGEVPAATVAAMHMAGADSIFLLGGVQAVAAMALGTETIPKVDIITGPGNAYVAEAKRQLFGQVGIDLFAGPTEILIVADENADPFIVAVDLLSQAEHGPDSPAILITNSESVADQTLKHIDNILPGMPTRDFAGPAWRDFGQIHIVDSLDDAFLLADTFAAEHVQILTESPRDALEKMSHYGALFLGEGTCVSYGDKTIGTNHVLPTRGAARYTGGLWVGKFLRTITYQEVTNLESSAFLGRVTGRTARIENFEGHARSGDARAAKYAGDTFPWIEDSSNKPGWLE
jgi:sulfopropanediol 3-dehydrogenase